MQGYKKEYYYIWVKILLFKYFSELIVIAHQEIIIFVISAVFRL